MSARAGAAGGTAADVIAAFEAERAQILRRRRFGNLAALLGASLVLALSLKVSGFTDTPLDDSALRRVAGFIDQLTPDLQPSALLEDRRTDGSLAAWFYDLPRWTAALWETLQMAVVGTMLGAAISAGLAFLAAGNVSPLGPFHHLVRRLFDAFRTIPDLILAIFFAAAFGLGAAAGVLTIVISTVGSLGKLYSEAIENTDLRSVEPMRAAGAGWAVQMRYGVTPQAMPMFVSYGLLRMEINLGAAAALGIVGAGGIGVELQRAITYTEFDTYLAIFLLLVAMIMGIDMISGALRRRIIGLKAR